MKRSRPRPTDAGDENVQLHEEINRCRTELGRKNRELEIEAALEQVRARTAIMQRSDELADAAQLLFHQFRTLNISTLVCGYIFIHEQKNIQQAWTVLPDGTLLPGFIDFPLTGDRILNERYKAWKAKVPLHKATVEGEENKKHHQFLAARVPAPIATGIFDHVPDRITFYSANFSQGYLSILAPEPISEEDEATVIRFARVFEQTYTRFLDLQKAEAQSRESQIQLSLERVRARTMSMQKSEELAEVAVNLFRQVSELGIKTWTTGFNVWSEDGNSYTDYITSPLGNLIKAYTIDTTTFRVFREVRDARNRGEVFWIQYLEGENLRETYRQLSKFGNEKQYEKMLDGGFEFPASQYVHFVFGSQVSLMFITYDHLPEARDLFIRFGIVFQQTYTRFLDLQKAEAQAKEAIKASSLDRVRAQIASMRTVDDLQQITPLIWKELIALGVPFVRCGVFILNESMARVQVYLSSPDGQSLATLDLSFDSGKLTAKVVDHWRKGAIFKTHWDKAEFVSWMQTMIREGQVQNQETYQGASPPPESLDLHFVPFKQGMLYVGNVSPLEPDELQGVKSLAESFSIAYARYEDFRQLEEAKNQIEKTFTELKATQSQLIQAEKMASLGELTAGIAHEIQNPLNFVNNFSEISRELIDEMNEELNKGAIKEAMVLARDIQQNLEKILHHGKRADGIVKGMLQHSRSSENRDGVKEPVELNKLVDEYLRMAFHGWRAKDKSFNATMKTDLDPSIGTIPLIPQDIGRVMLNLINNAFYAVNEKKQAPPPPGGGIYEPTVTVRTSLVPPSGGRGAKVLISVKDNGDGIPPKVMDKIFQPFFTTKPTGQGTGLGLSMSYDIVKAHGGELKVENREGEGAEFVVGLPV